MTVLVDTSVWIEHLRSPVPELVELLNLKQVVTHELIIGELACGSFKKRHEVLGNLKLLPLVRIATHKESLELIETHKLFGKGLGFVDIHLLASSLLSNARILTSDKVLRTAFEIISK